MTAAELRKRIASREGWQTRRKAALADLEATLKRARSDKRKAQLRREVKDAKAAVKEAAAELADLRRELADLRRQESEPPAPPSIPPPPPPVLPPPPPRTFEDRVLVRGGGVATLPDGRQHALIWVPNPPTTSELGEGDDGSDYEVWTGSWLDQIEAELDALDPFPGDWHGRLRVQAYWSDMDPYGYGQGEEAADPGDEYEVSDASSPPAGMSHMPPAPYTGRYDERKTLTGWTSQPRRLLQIMEIVGERLGNDDWVVTGIILEMVWDGAGKLGKGEVTQ